MRVKKIGTNEEFASPERRVAHDRKHRKDSSNEFPTNMFKSSYEYERAADKLAATPVKTSDINSKDNVVGFVELKDGEECYVKYDKSIQGLVIYVPSKTRAPKTGNLIKTFYKANTAKYNNLFDNFYLREIEND